MADIYEAITGARSYQDPAMPEQACLILARLAGTKLNTSIVKAFVSAISFFPIGSVVRTDRDEVGVVIRTTTGNRCIRSSCSSTRRTIGCRRSRHERPRRVRRLRAARVETLLPPDGLDVTALLAAS